ncbi:MAG: PQQ-binding-like beta-propeller repeat protein [Planctomycetota bacterium]
MRALQFIIMLEGKGLLAPEVIAELRRQVEQSKSRLTPESLAELLVGNGQLTRFQATRLITELNEKLGPATNDATTALRGGKPLDNKPSDHDSIEDLLPKEEVKAVEVVESEAVVAEVVEDVVEVAGSKRSKKKSSSRSDDSGLADIGIDQYRKPARDALKKSPWESFGVLGMAFVLLLLLILFVPLYVWFVQGSAKDEFAIAEEYYKNRDYDRAIKQYDKFASTYTNDENVSVAKVKSTLSKVRQEAERNADPSIGLKAAQTELPKVVNESGLAQLRGDIADTLLRIAEKFINKADNTAGTEDRKELIALMDEQMQLIDDPRFLGTQERNQNDLRIRRIKEDQQRVVREIQRSEDLAVTLQRMKQAVAAKEVNQVYELRRDLIRKYPQLEPDTNLRELMAQATEIQRESVTKAKRGPDISVDEPVADATRQVGLTSRVGNPLESAEDKIAFLRIKGSLVAIRVGTGEVVWRKFIGRDWNIDPQRTSPTADSDVLITVPSRGTMTRYRASDGGLVWQCKFPDRVLQPQIDGDDVFAATTEGTIACLDAITGQARWTKQIPQRIDVGFGGSPGKRKRYLLGNHSNLYVLSRGNGECEEVHYVGHNAGSISVPPIWILNQLIIFDNAGPDHSLMRVLSTNDDGVSLTAGQTPVRFKGHVVIEPHIEGRRMAVATNLGEIAILDVEVTNPKDKVFKMVNLVSNEANPKVTWPLMAGTDLWLASNRLAYFQIQVTGQKLNSMWIKEDADEFVSRPLRVGEALIHARIVRGNAGVRVAAVDPKSGNPYWELDVGNPVVYASPTQQGVLAVTSQAAVYTVDAASFHSTGHLAAATMAVENMGRNQRSMLFSAPTSIDDQRSLLLNTAQGSQILAIDRSRKLGSPTRLLNLDLAGSYPVASPLAVDAMVILPLENAQLMMIDLDTGAQVGTPFQPTISAGEKPVWLNPVLLADKKSVVVADQKRNLYKLSTGKQLRMLNTQPLERSLKGRLSVLEDVVVGVSPGASGDHLDFYESGELKKIAELNFEGRFAWGPFTLPMDDRTLGLAFNDIEGLVAFDASGKQLWSVPLPQMVLVGEPVRLGQDVLLTSTLGDLLRISSIDGRMVGKAASGEPASGTPIVLPEGILVPGDEGILIELPVPAPDESSVTGASR